jgi:hypothetical protein
MALRSTMATLITRVRQLANDPTGASQQFADTDIQDILDESRQDVYNFPLKAQPTFSGATILYLDYLSDVGGWEDGMVLRQYLTVAVTPSLIEPIAGHFQFAASTFPPIYLSGRLFDVYRAAADVLERWSARYATQFDFTSDSQSFHVSQASKQLLALAKTYRMKQRPGTITFSRGDMNTSSEPSSFALGPRPIDYMASG